MPDTSPAGDTSQNEPGDAEVTTEAEDAAPRCEVCAYEREECHACEGSGEDDYRGCLSCGGAGEVIPPHCCNCGGGEYDCICCPHCGAQNVGKCPCTLTVKTHDGGTLKLNGESQ